MSGPEQGGEGNHMGLLGRPRVGFQRLSSGKVGIHVEGQPGIGCWSPSRERTVFMQWACPM